MHAWTLYCFCREAHAPSLSFLLPNLHHIFFTICGPRKGIEPDLLLPLSGHVGIFCLGSWHSKHFVCRIYHVQCHIAWPCGPLFDSSCLKIRGLNRVRMQLSPPTLLIVFTHSWVRHKLGGQGFWVFSGSIVQPVQPNPFSLHFWTLKFRVFTKDLPQQGEQETKPRRSNNTEVTSVKPPRCLVGAPGVRVGQAKD